MLKICWISTVKIFLTIKYLFCILLSPDPGYKKNVQKLCELNKIEEILTISHMGGRGVGIHTHLIWNNCESHNSTTTQPQYNPKTT